MYGKKPLVVVLGAGASCALGFPDSKKLTRHIVSILQQDKDLIDLVDCIDRRLSWVLGDAYNFEHFWDAIEFIESFDQGRRFRQGHEVIDSLLIDGLTRDIQQWMYSKENGYNRYFYENLQETFFKTLRQELSKSLIEAPQTSRWAQYVEFLRRLQQEFSLFFVTLNYDLCLEHAFNQISKQEGRSIILEEGLDQGRFSLRRFREYFQGNALPVN